MGIAKYEPLHELRHMQDRMERLLDKSREKLAGDFSEEGFWQPAVDILEDPRSVVVKMEIPEVALEDIHVHVENRNLTIQGERHPDEGEPGLTCHRLERCFGPFRRTFALPATVDEDGIQATSSQGILKIVLPKKPASPLKQIDGKTE